MSPSKSPEGWNPPRELDCPLPRRVRLTASGIAVYVFTALLLVGGIMGAAAAARQGRHKQAEARQMRAEGRETEGVVTGMSRTGEDNDVFGVEYRFTVDGRAYGGSGSVENGHWHGLGVGMPIAIRYLPSAPAHNYPSADPPGSTGYWLGCFFCGVLAVIGALLPLVVRRQRHLLEGGRPALAVVRSVQKSQTENGPQYTAHYEFPLPGGGFWLGRSSSGAKYIPEGSAICILYDPDDPTHNAPYPLSLVKPAAD